MSKPVVSTEPIFLFSRLGHDLVLAVEKGSRDSCAQLVLEKFTGAAHQQFTYDNGSILTHVNNSVLDVRGGLGVGRDIIQYTRHNGPNQKFNINSDGSITNNEHGNYVLSVKGWNGEANAEVPAGSHVTLEERDGKANQLWDVKNVHGNIPAGSRWDYPYWGKCVAEWHNGELYLREVNHDINGSCTFHTKNGDGFKLANKLNTQVHIYWDNGPEPKEATAPDANTISVNHSGNWYQFKRVLPPNFENQTREIQKLWEAFQIFDKDGNGSISPSELENVLLSLGQKPSKQEIDRLIRESDSDKTGTVDFEEFKNMMVADRGDQASRLRLAFSIFDKDNGGCITAKEMESVMSQVGLTLKELEEMISELDIDGTGTINFEEFCKLVPKDEDNNLYPPSAQFSPLTYVPVQKKPAQQPAKAPQTAAAPTVATSAGAELLPEVKLLQDELAKHPTAATEASDKKGTSLLQYQIGLFRLIQGAAYRCFRESFSANHSTHMRVKGLPYRITDFVKFVGVAVSLYKAAGVISEDAHPVLDSLVESINAEFGRLKDRIANWKTIEKTPQMEAQHKSMLAKRNRSLALRQKFAAGVDLAITLKRNKHSLASITEGILAFNELNALREKELSAETTATSKPADAHPKEYLKEWNRVLLEDADEKIDGAMMPVAYWYEDFMPKLLAAFSVGGSEQTVTNTAVPNEESLDAWYNENQSKGVFALFARDVEDHFPSLTPAQKLSIAQAWRFTKHYLNGIQKRRERLEAGREDGALSNYVTFIDVYIGRNTIKNADMRISFPYFIGPAVWRFFHTSAELSNTIQDPEALSSFLNNFKQFFKLFATMYPCPYCRHHLNSCVVLTKEVEMYPMEYLLLGKRDDQTDFDISLDAKLDTITDGPSLRLFFWKLHNTVSSSIARTEEWYHSDQKAFYTTRYWPSLDSELARSQALGQISISVDRISKVYGLLKPAAHLGGLRSELQRHLDQKDIDMLKKVCVVAKKEIKEDLEIAVVTAGFLQDAYTFNASLPDASDPSFSPEEEKYARSGLFVEVL